MQSQYRNYQQHMPPQAHQVPQHSPHHAFNQPRRGYGGPMIAQPPPPQQQHHQQQHHPHPQQMSQAQMQAQQQAAAQAQAAELAKRRSKRPTDKNLPDGVEECIIDGEIAKRYKELRDVERRLDTMMTRKRLDVMEGVNRPAKLYKTMRIWITNTVEDQVWQSSGDLNVDAFDFSPNMEASYRVKIEGRLLDNDDEMNDAHPEQDGEKMDEDGAEDAKAKGASAAAPSRTRFSHFFREMNVDFDKARFRNGVEQSVEWKKPDQNNRNQAASPAADFDELTFKRSGDENMNVTINLFRHETPERYQFSPELADITDLPEGTHQEAVMALWEYIRMNNLQEDEEKRNFRCDDLLKRIIGQTEVGHVPALNEYVKRHLRPQAPISLPYTIRVDEDYHKDPQPTVYDVQVLADDTERLAVQAMVNNPQYVSMLKEVHGLDDQLARLVQAISVSHAKHSFFKSLSEDPANFVRNWLSSQKRDLDVIFGETPRSVELATTDEWRKGGRNSVWTTQTARESVNVLLSRPK